MPSPRIAVPAVTACLLFVIGCTFDPFCGPEFRDVTARAQISPPGVARIERMDVEMRQVRRDRLTADLSWTIVGVDLQYRVRALRLVSASNADSLLAELTAPSGGEMSGLLTLTVSRPADADRLRDLLFQSRAAVEITTDIPGRERIVAPLRSTSAHDWSRPTCGD